MMRRDHRHARGPGRRRSFAGILIDTRGGRRAVEAQAASHLVHLGRTTSSTAAGLAPSRRWSTIPHPASRRCCGAWRWTAPPSTPAALSHWASSRAGLDPRVVGDVLAIATRLPAVDAARPFPGYLATTMRELLRVIDQWPEP
ncbi:MAG: hypothetical protein R2712_01955 [Vicinamibacterales bacterium]